jgi:putative two-component system response regulator
MRNGDLSTAVHEERAGEAAPPTEVLLVDDDEALLSWSERLLRKNGYSCDSAGDAAVAQERLARHSYALAMLDVNMPPGESGLDLLVRIRTEHPDTAVVMITGEDDPGLAMTAIEHGAYGYMVKPVGAGEMLINVANALHRRARERQNERLMRSLQVAVEDRGNELEGALQDLRISNAQVWVSQAEMIFRLARLVEFRDEETGHHLQRMSSYCDILARELGLPSARCEQVRLASQLHDIGKVAIPDAILLKPGRLTEEERRTIQTHAQIGYEMLAGSSAEVAQLGALIARAHHEHWDGRGYPLGLAGEAIPLEGRIAAVADVYDALTSTRIYRPAFPVRRALETMQSERGTHFDPAVLDAFMKVLPELEPIRQTYGGE